MCTPTEHLRGQWKQVATAALWCVALLALLDVGLIRTPVLSDFYDSPNFDGPREKLLLAPRYADSQMLLFGDSRVLTGVDPDIFSVGCACGPAFNAGYSSADTILVHALLDRFLAVLHPRVVGIGLTYWEMSDGGHIQTAYQARTVLPPWELGPYGGLPSRSELPGAVLRSFWHLYDLRDDIRESIVNRAHGQETDFRRGFKPEPSQAHAVGPFVRPRDTGWPSLDSARARALRASIRELQARGIAVLLFELPYTPAMLDVVRDDVAAFHEVVGTIASEEGVPFYSMAEPEWTKDDLFVGSTSVHLNEDGARLVSYRLGQEFRAQILALQ